MEIQGSYRVSHKFVIVMSRGTLEVKKEERWKRYLLTGKVARAGWVL